MSHNIAPFAYICNIKGKNFRNGFIKRFATLFQCTESYCDLVCDLVTDLHNVSLLIDDIEDQSVLRRGEPAAHRIFGEARTFNSANLQMLSTINDCSVRNPQWVPIIIKELISMHEGQGDELFWREQLLCPTIEQYENMAAKKTAGLLILAVRLLMLECRKPHNAFIKAAKSFGIGYQMIDDYANLVKYRESKGFAEDISEGKFSFPIILALHNHVEDAELIPEILKLRTQDKDLKEKVIEILKNGDSLDQCLKMGQEKVAECLRIIESAGYNSDELSSFFSSFLN